ncbi:MAG TPA: Sapep family Mn(2+)-dependent dipeptidase [Eubacteriales bacterium]|nr:Sapep family Mn(2+)-dependent dipeptidase [Eubacteriales bacterium]
MYKHIEDSFDAQVEALRDLIRIPSVSRGTPEPGKPLGRHVHDALHYTLNLARKLGFTKVFDLDGYCGVIEYGEGKETLGVMAHLDVVPEGRGWHYPPYGAEIANGKIYGRGTMDDKGEAVSALFALAAIKDSGLPLKRRIRLILGCDEERGSLCMARYKETEPEPDLAFTPDADYPLVNSEMGIFHGTYIKDAPSAVRMKVGTAANVIPGDASCELPVEPVKTELHEGFTANWGKSLVVTGFGGHAASAWLAKNALCQLIEIVAAQKLDSEDSVTFKGLNELFDMCCHGEHFGVDVTDDSGETSLNLTMLEAGADGVRITIDSRYPFSLPFDTLLAALDEKLGALGFVRGDYSNSHCHYIDPESELVRTLMDIYNTKTGKQSKPLAIGGGTYARAFRNAVAFGCEPEDGVALAHMPDECVSFEEMKFNTEIMAEAMRRLAGE